MAMTMQATYGYAGTPGYPQQGYGGYAAPAATYGAMPATYAGAQMYPPTLPAPTAMQQPNAQLAWTSYGPKELGQALGTAQSGPFRFFNETPAAMLPPQNSIGSMQVQTGVPMGSMGVQTSLQFSSMPSASPPQTSGQFPPQMSGQFMTGTASPPQVSGQFMPPTASGAYTQPTAMPMTSMSYTPPPMQSGSFVPPPATSMSYTPPPMQSGSFVPPAATASAGTFVSGLQAYQPQQQLAYQQSLPQSAPPAYPSYMPQQQQASTAQIATMPTETGTTAQNAPLGANPAGSFVHYPGMEQQNGAGDSAAGSKTSTSSKKKASGKVPKAKQAKSKRCGCC